MGKTEDNTNLHVSSESTETNPRCSNNNNCYKSIISFKCLFILILSISLFLSALFLLLPLQQTDSNLDPRFRGHAIVTCFTINRPVSFVNKHILQLQNDIFQEMSYISINVTILALDEEFKNRTKVIFGIDQDTGYREILPLSLSSIKEMFESVLIYQSSIQLTKSLFGETVDFEVLKFPGGITVIPPQSVFPLQKFKLVFNFTLNYSIHQIQMNFNTLASQLKNGLNLAPYENLYVSLSNSDGSTVSPPTTVHSSVLLRVGTSNPRPRLKQLTDTITDSRSKNLGLNNTIFGKVKQVRLLSFLTNSSDSSSKAPAPSPQPQPQPHRHHHHHHHTHHHHRHHHHHHHHHRHHLGPEVSPVASPAPKRAPPPSNVGSGGGRRENINEKNYHSAPAPSAKKPPRHHQIVPISAPLPNVVFAHTAQPPVTEPREARATQVVHPPQPQSSSSNIGVPVIPWIILLMLIVVIASGLDE